MPLQHFVAFQGIRKNSLLAFSRKTWIRLILQKSTPSTLLAVLSFVSVSFLASDLHSPVKAQTAGCGSGWSNTALKVLSPVGSNQFRVACDEHDACYDTYGRSKQACDNAFHNRMLGICASDHNTIFGTPLRIACNGRADAYFAAVRDHGDDAYQKAQSESRKILSNKWSGRCLQTMGQERQNGSMVNIWDCTNTSNQFWALSDSGELRNGWSGKCLQTMGQEKSNGSDVNIWECTGTSNQLWERTSAGEFRNKWSGKCLQTMGQDSQNGSVVNIWDCTGTTNQMWQ